MIGKRIGASVLAVSLALCLGCNAARRTKVLRIFFDGVPDPHEEVAAPAPEAGTAPAPLTRRVAYGEHGPYSARLCNGCHQPGTNALLAPKDQLCFRCHDVAQNKRHVHGPLASGGCLACHDPHGSQYRYLLVSESDTFCLHCHDRDAVMRSPAHAGQSEQCTDCHDAHMSDKEHLLK